MTMEGKLMRYGRENVAYDLSRFEPRSNAVRKPEEPPASPKTAPQKKKKAQKKQLSPLAVLKWATVSGLVMAALLAVMVSNLTLNELDQQISASQNQLNVAKSEYVSLNMELESRTSLQNVEDYAVNKLGLEKIGQYQIQYVRLAQQDKVELSNDGNLAVNFFDGLINRIVEYF